MGNSGWQYETKCLKKSGHDGLVYTPGWLAWPVVCCVQEPENDKDSGDCVTASCAVGVKAGLKESEVSELSNETYAEFHNKGCHATSTTILTTQTSQDVA